VGTLPGRDAKQKACTQGHEGVNSQVVKLAMHSKQHDCSRACHAACKPPYIHRTRTITHKKWECPIIWGPMCPRPRSRSMCRSSASYIHPLAANDRWINRGPTIIVCQLVGLNHRDLRPRLGRGCTDKSCGYLCDAAFLHPCKVGCHRSISYIRLLNHLSVGVDVPQVGCHLRCIN